MLIKPCINNMHSIVVIFVLSITIPTFQRWGRFHICKYLIIIVVDMISWSLLNFYCIFYEMVEKTILVHKCIYRRRGGVPTVHSKPRQTCNSRAERSTNKRLLNASIKLRNYETTNPDKNQHIRGCSRRANRFRSLVLHLSSG